MNNREELSFPNRFKFASVCFLALVMIASLVITIVERREAFLAFIFLAAAIMQILSVLLLMQDMKIEPAVVTNNGITFRSHIVRRLHFELKVMLEFQWSDIYKVVLCRRNGGTQQVYKVYIGGTYTPDKPGSTERDVVVTISSSTKGFDELLQALQAHVPEKIKEARIPYIA